MGDILQFFDSIPIGSPEESVLNSMMYEFFRYRCFKNITQREAIIEIMKRDSDVIVSLPKGYGRTMCFQLPVIVSIQKVSIVFVALTSRIKVQIERLKNKNNYVEVLSSKTTADQWSRIFNNIYKFCNMLSSKNTVLYMTLELASSFFLMHLMQYLVLNNELGFIVVDEAYHENYWSLGQSKEYNGLRKLRKTFQSVPWIVTTADGSTEVINRIKTTLCLHTHRPDLPKDSISCYGFFKDDVCLDR
ncbi:ATP-dependent DNA helicase Q5-like [Rhopalosiphum maidis]|uniref:ATP-dependent DNA helicase Q5-like n=1 Tax=Rhopalosiphum maidis TaxID=43146 RepID=UPI000F003517|nr:ATP-dependent DNA helicase Q5-like [Rhopalosiphum maidis]XP_026820112.1 ATP-dependent DNA helicase Q5-like [Rhopalosiphum maidis]